MKSLQKIVRSPGDPKVEHSGPGSRDAIDQLGRGLGWFSIGLGLSELVAAGPLARLLGMAGKEGLLRAYGAREIGAGILTLSTEKDVGLWSRVAGDGLDILSLAGALRTDNPQRGNVGLALAAVLGVTVLDVLAAQRLASRRRSRPARRHDYSRRSGFPRGLEHARGAAKDFLAPRDMKAAPELASP